MKRPEPTEYAPYYKNYIDLVKVDNPIKALEDQIIAMQAFLSEIPEDRESYRYAANKWSIKEIIGHLIDTERIFGYRALCIARKDKTSFPGYDENAYVAAANFDSRSFYDLVHEFSIVRESHLALFKSFAPEAFSEMGTANQQPVSVRAILFIMAGHEIHHLKVIRERYLNS
ncbi:MAG: DinB family protein [Bacteroidetes bacterium]|nr:DinB family protein [Bacteroidota bacterium]MBK9798272.1 DinB family protein [Bacteroidota bacterium]MBP6414296.1 DinB family protein [Bacteroidia bacterium]